MEFESQRLRKRLGVYMEIIGISSMLVNHFLSLQINVYLALYQVIELKRQIKNLWIVLLRLHQERVFSKIELIVQSNGLLDLLALMELVLSVLDLLRLQNRLHAHLVSDSELLCLR